MIIGVPKEIMSGEDRVAATPETVADMVGKGLTVLVETCLLYTSDAADDTASV